MRNKNHLRNKSQERQTSNLTKGNNLKYLIEERERTIIEVQVYANLCMMTEKDLLLKSSNNPIALLNETYLKWKFHSNLLLMIQPSNVLEFSNMSLFHTCMFLSYRNLLCNLEETKESMLNS